MAVFALEQLLKTMEATSEDAFQATLEIPPDLPAFDGHFPEEPILPGIVQIQIVRELLERHLAQPLRLLEVTRARMSQMVLPNDHIEVEVSLEKISPHEDTPTQTKADIWLVKALVKKSSKITTRLRLRLQSCA